MIRTGHLAVRVIAVGIDGEDVLGLCERVGIQYVRSAAAEK
jgi:hypothetical protein